MLVAFDTNVLLRLVGKDDIQHQAAASALRSLLNAGHQVCYMPQNIVEFWNVSTRPVERNGFGLSLSVVGARVAMLESVLTLLPDDERVHGVWRTTVMLHEVRGAQVHDARLAASLWVHGVSRLITWNGRDFHRYPWITAITPEAALVAI